MVAAGGWCSSCGFPSCHRGTAWREPRRIGALSLGRGTWAAPDVPAVADGIARLADHTERVFAAVHEM